MICQICIILSTDLESGILGERPRVVSEARVEVVHVPRSTLLRRPLALEARLRNLRPSHIRDPIRDPIREPIRDQIRDQTRDSIRHSISDPIGDPIRDPISDPIRDPISRFE